MALSEVSNRDAVEWRLRTTTLSTAAHTLIMGVLNVTPDSFSDGGRYDDTATAVAQGLAMRYAGADIIDIGGESTRPGAAPVSVTEEIERVVPVVAALAGEGVVVSVDTMKPAVAEACVVAGAEIVNDVSGLRDPAMLEAVVQLETGVVIMHMRGTPRTMQHGIEYEDVVTDVAAYLEAQAAKAIAAGVARERVCVDPGIGFGKTHTQNLAILDRADEFFSLGYPLMIGASRKGFLGTILSASGCETVAAERDAATGATVVAGIIGGASVVRVHDVPSAFQVARTTDAIVRAHFEGRKSIGRT